MNDKVFRIDRKSFPAFGELVKKWVDGSVPRPVTADILDDQLKKHGVTAHYPAHWVLDKVRVDYMQMHDDHLLFAIPTPKMIKDGEDEALKVQNGYPMPDAYNQIYKDPTPNSLSDPQKLDVFCARVGDYCAGKCV